MNRYRGLAGVVLAAALVAAGCAGSDPGQGRDEPTTEFTSDQGVRITVDSPRAQSTIESPLLVTGRAPGSWSFEADFQVDVLDAKRRTIAEGFATMQGEWMTEEDVDFEGQLEFKRPATTAGFVVLRRANPSDLRENDDQVEIPVRFAAEPAGAY